MRIVLDKRNGTIVCGSGLLLYAQQFAGDVDYLNNLDKENTLCVVKAKLNGKDTADGACAYSNPRNKGEVSQCVGDQRFSSCAILEAMFLKPMEVPEIRLKRTPFRLSRGSLQISISHWTSESALGSPWTQRIR